MRIRTRAVWLTIAVSLTTAALANATAAAASSTSRVSASGGSRIAAPKARARPAAKVSPSILLNPSTAYPDNPLCDSLGIGGSFPNLVTVDGSHFAKKAKTVTVSLGGKKVATTTSATDGTFESQFSDPEQPIGTYSVLAKQGKKKQATAPLFSSAETCWTANGQTGQPLDWQWSGSGFDAGSTASFAVDGTTLKTAKASTTGAFTKAWTGACPSAGTLDVTVTGTFQGSSQTLDVGTVKC